MKPYLRFFRLENLFIGLALILFVRNLYFSLVYCKTKEEYTLATYYEPGYQFLKIKERIASAKQIGYLTNKDLSAQNNDGTFLQAQYFLAPTLIKLNDNDHRFLILDYSKETFLFYQIKTLKLRPLVDNLYGQVLTEKK